MLVEGGTQRVVHQVFRHQGMIPLIPGMEKKIRRYINIQRQPAQDQQEDRPGIVTVAVKAPGNPIAKGSTKERDDAPAEVVHGKATPVAGPGTCPDRLER